MTLVQSCLVAFLAVTVTGPTVPKENGGSFVVRLGNDTTSVEHFKRTANGVEVDQVGRAPRVIQRHYKYDFANGAMTHMSFVATPAGSTTPTQTIEASFDADSARLEIHNGAVVQNTHVAVPAGTVVIASSSPWAIYEGQTMKLAKSKADSLHSALYYMGAPDLNWMVVRKLGRDSMIIQTGNDTYHARVDRAGHILGTRPISGTQRFSIERVSSMDVPAMASVYAAVEKQSGTMGALSPRDTVHAENAGGATLWIDYSRPGKRGRTVYGGVVPYGEVWRTGANAATQFRTDKPLVMGGLTIPAGFYSLWTIPSPTGWKLIINSETGQWGTAHKADKDLFVIDMTTTALPDPEERFTITVVPNETGGVMNFDWDTTRASVPFTVQR